MIIVGRRCWEGVRIPQIVERWLGRRLLVTGIDCNSRTWLWRCYLSGFLGGLYHRHKINY